MARVKQPHVSLAQRLGLSVPAPAAEPVAAPVQEPVQGPIQGRQWTEAKAEARTRFGPLRREPSVIESGSGPVRIGHRNWQGDIEIYKGEKEGAEKHGRKFKFDKTSESHKHFLLNSKGAKIHAGGFMSLPKSDMAALKEMQKPKKAPAKNKAKGPGIEAVAAPKMAPFVSKPTLSPAEKEKLRQEDRIRRNEALRARKNK